MKTYTKPQIKSKALNGGCELLAASGPSDSSNGNPGFGSSAKYGSFAVETEAAETEDNASWE